MNVSVMGKTVAVNVGDLFQSPGTPWQHACTIRIERLTDKSARYHETNSMGQRLPDAKSHLIRLWRLAHDFTPLQKCTSGDKP